jgi:hypothetical protein
MVATGNKWPWLKRSVQLLLGGLLMLMLFGCANRSQSIRLLDLPDVPTGSEVRKLGGAISEVAPPAVFLDLAELMASDQPQVAIAYPKPDQVLSETHLSAEFKLRGLSIYKDKKIGLGPHLQVTLDNQPAQAVYSLDEPLELRDLSPGGHTLRVMAVRPWGESFKNEAAYAQTTFHVLAKTRENQPDAQKPLLTYVEPQGTFGAEPILLDFYLNNAPLRSIAQESPDDDILDWRLRCTINGQSFLFDQWQPVYLKGFKPGQNWVQMTLEDEQGNPIDNVFNSAVRIINYDPSLRDSLAKMVRGELPLDKVGQIAVPTYEPPALPEPVESEPADQLENQPADQPADRPEDQPAAAEAEDQSAADKQKLDAEPAVENPAESRADDESAPAEEPAELEKVKVEAKQLEETAKELNETEATRESAEQIEKSAKAIEETVTDLEEATESAVEAPSPANLTEPDDAPDGTPADIEDKRPSVFDRLQTSWQKLIAPQKSPNLPGAADSPKPLLVPKADDVEDAKANQPRADEVPTLPNSLNAEEPIAPLEAATEEEATKEATEQRSMGDLIDSSTEPRADIDESDADESDADELDAERSGVDEVSKAANGIFGRLQSAWDQLKTTQPNAAPSPAPTGVTTAPVAENLIDNSFADEKFTDTQLSPEDAAALVAPYASSDSAEERSVDKPVEAIDLPSDLPSALSNDFLSEPPSLEIPNQLSAPAAPLSMPISPRQR